ncbi:hypothetical protein ACIBG8_18615 [Nonomuraea sp. NPDC050556]|uniref:hypothetical protein n=1 Tax=Nonomuraea sp. NPDC050556 TaxID=3364369 RepID=UPI0037A444AD
MIALTRFRISAYIRSHRVYQAFLLLLIVIGMVYSNRAPVGGELAALTDAAVLIIPVLAWSARSLLDTEPDDQRIISATAVGGPFREVTAGLAAVLAVNLVFAGLTFGWGLLLGLSASPSSGVLGTAGALHFLALLTGTALGALTSRPILRSPALSIMALLVGFLAMLLLSIGPLYWLTVPVTLWMRAAGAGTLVDQLPALGAISLGWALLGLAAYGWLRRTRP